MEKRGLRAKGFFQDDAKVLQVELEKEHELYIVEVRHAAPCPHHDYITIACRAREGARALRRCLAVI